MRDKYAAANLQSARIWLRLIAKRPDLGGGLAEQWARAVVERRC